MVPVEVEGHAPEPKSIGQRLTDKIKSIVEDNNDEPEPEGSRRSGGHYASLRKQKEEVANLILTVFVVGVAAIDIPDTLKPERDELATVSNHMTSILARHNLLLGKLSGDALDVVGIIAVGAGWYARVAPELRRMRGNRDPGSGGGGRPGPGPGVPPAPAGDHATTPISNIDAVTGGWLDNQLRASSGEE